MRTSHTTPTPQATARLISSCVSIHAAAHLHVVIFACFACQKQASKALHHHQSSISSSVKMGTGIELPVDTQSRLAVGAVGMGFSVLLFLVASFRLGKFCQAYGWKMREVVG